MPEFSDTAVSDPSVTLIGKTLRFVDDATMDVDAVRIAFKYQHQPATVITIVHAKGSLADPLTDADLERKLEDLAAYGKPGYDPSALIEQVWALENVADVSQLMHLAA